MEAFNDSRDNYDWYRSSRDRVAEITTNAVRLANITPFLDCAGELPILAAPFPSLFSMSLSPCGLYAQMAYQNILHRLRRLHIHHSGTTSILSICEAIRDLLDVEEQASRVGTQALTGTRSPWRREIVFDYEMRWAKYFVREAEVLERWKEMDEMQRAKQVLAHRLYPVPKELNIIFRNRVNVKEVHKLWKAWQEEKRADIQMDAGAESKVEKEQERLADLKMGGGEEPKTKAEED